MRTMLFVCLVVQSFAQSTPRNRAEQKQGTHDKQNGANNTPGSAATPPATKPGGIDQPRPGDKDSPTEKKSDNVWEHAFSPETWSNWGLLVAAGLASWLAFRSLGVIRRQTEEAIRAGRLAEMALHLTERADILLEGISLSSPGLPPNTMGAQTVITLVFKNFGRTRANEVRIRFWLGVPGANPAPEPPRIPTVLASGDAEIMPFPRIGESVNQETFQRVMNGAIPLQFTGEVTYKDVFGFQHKTICAGTFRPKPLGFDVDRNYAD